MTMVMCRSSLAAVWLVQPVHAEQQAQTSLSTTLLMQGRSRYFAQASKLGKAQFWPVANGRCKPPASQRLATAIANKLTRIAWTVLMQARSYEARVN
jgi:hypothetical protein